MLPIDLVHKVISEQFPELADLSITAIDKQGHDNSIFRLGEDMLIRMPTRECYAAAVEKEQKFLPLLSNYLTANIPRPLKLAKPSKYFKFPFSIYKWLEGQTLSQVSFDNWDLEKLAFDLAKFLKEFQNVNIIDGPLPGSHNWWRGDHISVYDKDTKKQIKQLSDIIDGDNAINLWEQACKTKWDKSFVWIHGDFAVDNILIKDNKLFAIIDFGCMGVGDPACDLVIAWTFLKDKAREIFIGEMDLENDTWLRAKAWALWKASYELCKIKNKHDINASMYKKIIDILLYK